ncbi:TlpA disulfide reductase family protein [Solwaraspora sp. WMMA2056]|uniref:TlpA family protein disulfide reductase n=1 Tax=Solwaraspora sp. WMMA2056 TaxID=3015161 RepID=UPI00259BF260|nr:TlpA disulfide reductase family protein [Solwaraspora sp. WMMA2056]WJK41215.1 TlpA disulfide reductase family protein [Solwaraspora sp. WMMA2056]
MTVQAPAASTGVMPGWRRLLAVAVPLLMLAGCGGGAGGGSTTEAGAVPFADCAGLTTAPPASTAPPDAAAPPTDGVSPDATPTGTSLPAIELACFADGTPVAVDAIRGPAVINFWASWCEPCRDELPALQRLADRTDGQLHLVGVNTWDDRDRAVAIAEDLGLSFPSLVDRDRALLLGVERVGLPLTLFVDDRGTIRHTYEGTVDDATLAELVQRELGLPVAR